MWRDPLENVFTFPAVKTYEIIFYTWNYLTVYKQITAVKLLV